MVTRKIKHNEVEVLYFNDETESLESEHIVLYGTISDSDLRKEATEAMGSQVLKVKRIYEYELKIQMSYEKFVKLGTLVE